MGIRNGRAYQQPVRLGLQGNTQIEILDGIADGGFAIPATSGMLTGQRIRPILP
jgi:HlyD family secretion protein